VDDRESGSLRSELSEIVDPELFLERGHFVEIDVETVAAEGLPLNLFELFAQRIVLMGRDDLVELGE